MEFILALLGFAGGLYLGVRRTKKVVARRLRDYTFAPGKKGFAAVEIKDLTNQGSVLP